MPIIRTLIDVFDDDEEAGLKKTRDEAAAKKKTEDEAAAAKAADDQKKARKKEIHDEIEEWASVNLDPPENQTPAAKKPPAAKNATNGKDGAS